MAGNKERHEEAFALVLQDLNDNVPDFLDSVLNFLDEKTTLASRDTLEAKKVLNSAVNRHFKGLPAKAAFRKIWNKYKPKLIDPKTSKF